VSGTVQFLRACSLQVVGDDGAGLDLSELRVRFQVTHGSVQTPRIMQARVYNPAPATVTAIQSQFTRVILSAGYQGNVAQIFSGTIAQTRYGRENPTDTFIDIFGTTNEQSYATATTMQVLAAGWTHQDARDQCVKDMATDQIAAGAFPELQGSGARPKVMCGMTRDVLRTTAASAAAVWNMDDATLNFTRIADMVNAGSVAAIELDSTSGLVGIPVQVPGGVQATCLLNPALKPGAAVTIHTGDVLASQADLSYAAQDGGNYDETTTANGVSRRSVIGLSPSGSYLVVFVEITGDTRGDEWYSTITCQATDVSAVTPGSFYTAN